MLRNDSLYACKFVGGQFATYKSIRQCLYATSTEHTHLPSQTDSLVPEKSAKRATTLSELCQTKADLHCVFSRRSSALILVLALTP